MSTGPLKRYLVFAGDTYYPGGGWDDLLGDYDSLDEAKTALARQRYDWYEIIDSTTGEAVKS